MHLFDVSLWEISGLMTEQPHSSILKAWAQQDIQFTWLRQHMSTAQTLGAKWPARTQVSMTEGNSTVIRKAHLLHSVHDLADGLCALVVALPGELQGEHGGRHALQEALDGVQRRAAALIRVTALLVLRIDALHPRPISLSNLPRPLCMSMLKDSPVVCEQTALLSWVRLKKPL